MKSFLTLKQMEQNVRLPHRAIFVFLVGLAPFLTGCVSVPISPALLRTAQAQYPESPDALSRWEKAVERGNAFLRSPYRKTLPEGQLRLTTDGMEFVTAKATLPIRIRCTRFGDFTVACGFSAQERSNGFIVGRTKSARTRLLDNSFFRFSEGEPMPPDSMAELILHELTHSYYRCGTVSFTQGFLYYGETIFLFRYQNHSMERVPFETSAEFEKFIRMGDSASAAPGK